MGETKSESVLGSKPMILEILQVILTLVETGMCLWACDALVYKGEFAGKYKRYFIICAGVITCAVVWNRRVVLFSFLVLIMQSVLVWSIFLIGSRRKKLLSFMFIADYHLLTALLDFAFAFLGISYLGEDFWSEIYYKTGSGRILIYILARTLMFIACYILNYYSEKLKFEFEDYKAILLGFGIVGSIWGWWFLTMLFERSSSNNLGDSLFVITCLIILITLMTIEIKSIYIKTQSQMILMKNELLEENYNNFRDLYENSRYIYHDFKNHMFLLKNYLECEQYEKARHYLENIVEPMEKLSNFTYCDNMVLNLVLNLKGYEANKKGIQFLTEIHREPLENIDENDLGNIFLNLLENAIEACEKIEKKDKWIHVIIKKKKHLSIIKIENSIEKEILMKAGKYVTAKDNKAIHGLGMQSVKALVGKYSGEVQWQHTKDIFTVVITFFGMDYNT